jgi:hypothetical protein
MLFIKNLIIKNLIRILIYWLFLIYLKALLIPEVSVK